MKRALASLPFKGILLFSLVSVASAAAAAESPRPPALRLPAGVAPTRYAAELWVDPAKDAFRGRIEIEISSKEETGAVWLNAKELDVQAVSARPAGGGAAIAGAAAKAGSDYVRLTFQRNLSPGPWFLSLEYTGRVESKDTEGVFHQKDGADWYAYTQFEAIYARRAFPCFDEPSFKTPWQLTLHVPKGSIAVSNTPVASEAADPDGGRKFVFAPTKPLPSYLVAFGVGPFDVVSAGTAGRNHTPIRMIVPKGHARGGALGRRVHGADPRRARDLLRDPVPVREARQPRDPADGRLRRDGERGPHHVRVESHARASPPTSRSPSAGGTRASARTRRPTSGSGTT